MRTLTAPEVTALEAAARKPVRRIEITDAAGDYQDFTWAIHAGVWQTDVDKTVIEGRFLLRRSNPSDSLSPYVTDAIDAGRRLRLYHATILPDGTIPDPEDLHLVFDAEIDSIDAGDDPIEIVVHDWIGATLAHRHIKEPRLLGGPGVAWESVLQQILNVGGGLAITLEADASGITVAKTVEVGGNAENREPVHTVEAVRTWANRIGWQVRPRWSDSEGAFVLAAYEPPRDSTDVAWVYGPDRYKLLPRFKRSREDVRNAVEIEFRRASTGLRHRITGIDQTSIDAFGEQWAEFIETDDSVIDTIERAQALRDAFLSDVGFPQIDASVVVPLNPFLDLDDRITLEANDVTHGTDQTLAIVAYRHEFGPDIERSTFDLRGKPTGGVRKWKDRLAVGGRGPTSGELIAFHAESTPDGATVVLVGEAGSAVVQVAIFARLMASADLPSAADTAGWKALWGIVESELHFVTFLEPDTDNQFVHQMAAPDEDHVILAVARPYALSPAGRWIWGGGREVVVRPAAGQLADSYTDFVESEDSVTVWLRLVDRGMAFDPPQFYAQVGAGALLDVATTRTQGDASILYGGTLGEDEFELDVTLDAYRATKIVADVLHENGENKTIVWPAFDRDRSPDFAVEPRADANGILSVDGDADTISQRVERIDGVATWLREVDSWRGLYDLMGDDDSGNPGQSTDSAALYRITLYSDPIADIDGDTLTETRELLVPIGTVVLSGWVTTTLDIPDVGSAVLTITLEADSAEVGHTVRVWYRAQLGGGEWDLWADVTASLSPVPGAPPTTPTAYEYQTAHPRSAKDVTLPIVSVEVRAEILNASDVVVASTQPPLARNWYAQP